MANIKLCTLAGYIFLHGMMTSLPISSDIKGPCGKQLNSYKEYTNADGITSVSTEAVCFDLKGAAYDALLQGIISSPINVDDSSLTEAQKLEKKYHLELLSYTYLPYFDVTKTSRYLNYKMEHQDWNWETIITRVGVGLDNPYYTNVTVVSDPGAMNVLINKYNEIPDWYAPSDLVNIGGGYQLRSEAAAAYKQMCADASADGISLWPKSAYRSHSVQESNYWGKVSARGQEDVDKTNARPGHSEHELALAIDLNSLSESFKNTAEGQWIAANCYKYGFIVRYPDGLQSITGYSPEPWHCRYLGVDLATAVYNSGLTYDEYYVRYIASPIINPVPKVNIDGQATEYSRNIICVDGVSYLPMKETCNILGYDVNWNANTNEITITNGYISWKHIGGTNEFTANGKVVKINTSTFVSNGMTYVSTRDICRIFGAQVTYDSPSATIIVTSYEKSDAFLVLTGTDYTSKSEAKTYATN